MAKDSDLASSGLQGDPLNDPSHAKRRRQDYQKSQIGQLGLKSLKNTIKDDV